MPGQGRTTEIIPVNPENPGREAIARAAEVLLSGGIIGFPTETVYGLGANVLNPEALKHLYTVKERDMKKPTSILIVRREDLSLFTDKISPGAKALIEKFWPGPLTIIFNAAPAAPELITAGTGTIGIRMPGSAVCLALLEKAGIPVSAPSANPRGKPPALSAGEVMGYFRGRIDLVMDGGKSGQKTPSTIVDSTGDLISVIREGPISVEDIRAAVPS